MSGSNFALSLELSGGNMPDLLPTFSSSTEQTWHFLLNMPPKTICTKSLHPIYNLICVPRTLLRAHIYLYTCHVRTLYLILRRNWHFWKHHFKVTVLFGPPDVLGFCSQNLCPSPVSWSPKYLKGWRLRTIRSISSAGSPVFFSGDPALVISLLVLYCLSLFKIMLKYIYISILAHSFTL